MGRIAAGRGFVISVVTNLRVLIGAGICPRYAIRCPLSLRYRRIGNGPDEFPQEFVLP